MFLEIRDIDAWAVKEDIVDAIFRETPAPGETIRVINLRPAYGGTQTALVLMPVGQTSGFVDKGRLKICLVSCRVRVAERGKTRCFKCLAFDHESKDYKGPDRSK